MTPDLRNNLRPTAESITPDRTETSDMTTETQPNYSDYVRPGGKTVVINEEWTTTSPEEARALIEEYIRAGRTRGDLLPARRTSTAVVPFTENPPGGPPPLPPVPAPKASDLVGRAGTGVAVALVAGAGCAAAVDNPAWMPVLAAAVLVTGVTGSITHWRTS